MMLEEEMDEEIWVHDFNDEDVLRFKNQIHLKFQVDPKKPIQININSAGGAAHGLLAMLDIMDGISSVTFSDSTAGRRRHLRDTRRRSRDSRARRHHRARRRRPRRRRSRCCNPWYPTATRRERREESTWTGCRLFAAS